MKILLILSVFFFNNLYSQNLPKDNLLDSMSEELNRSYLKLKDAEKSPLFFLQYEAWDESNYQLSANLGAVSSEYDNRQIVISADVRIGDRLLDNTHEIKGKESEKWDANSKDIDQIISPQDDKSAIKLKLWNLTDKAYKEALNKYLKVLMNKQVTAEEEDKSGDFSIDKTTDIFYQKAPLANIDKEMLKGKLKKLSLKFKDYDFLINSGISFNYTLSNRYIVNSDGARIVNGNNYMRLIYSLSARTTDGLDLSRVKTYDFDDMKNFPKEETIAKDIDESIAELKNLLNSPNQEPYTGPAILENRAAAVFWHEILGHRLEGHRQKSESEGQTFAKKVGEKIMPDFLTIYDDPNIHDYKGQFLRGYYFYDDEGVRSQRANLVENGVLKGFLMQRVPLEKFPHSNGHGRRSEGNMTVARQGNLIIESSKKVSYDKLRELLIEETKKSGKPYGLIIKDIAGGFTITQRFLPQSYTILIKYAIRVYPDGRPDEPIKGLNMIGTPLQTFQNIIYTADDDNVFDGTCGAESGWVPVSSVSPSLLFSQIETEKVEKSNEKPPILKPPFFDKETK